MKKLLFLSLFIMFAVNVFAQEVPFTLEVTNVRSDKGNIMVGICSTEDQFLEKDKCTYAFSMPAAKGTMVKNLNHKNIMVFLITPTVHLAQNQNLIRH